MSELLMTLCPADDSILISGEVFNALNYPEQVQMLINEERRMLLLQACSVSDEEAIMVPREMMPQFELSGHALLKRIRRLTGWADELPRVVYGNYIGSHRAIVFDLNTAQPVMYRMPLGRLPGAPN